MNQDTYGARLIERTLLSRNQAAMLRKGQSGRPDDALKSDQEIEDPLVLEFLDSKDEFSENDLEQAIIRHLEAKKSWSFRRTYCPLSVIHH